MGLALAMAMPACAAAAAPAVGRQSPALRAARFAGKTVAAAAASR